MPKPFKVAAILASVFLACGDPAPGQANWIANGNWHRRSQQQTPHPAIVRVTAAEDTTSAQGSGTLVDVNERYGLVITNWHVIRNATRGVTVSFPDGFQSPATVVRQDPDWDLAALRIWRPRTAPLPISRTAPRPGERLTIAGYGSGQYEASAGLCTQYVAPGANFPFEMVEVTVQAREGDSGGPILNDRGELAGVLFGAGGGSTAGSYCGRVAQFLQPVLLPDGPSPAVRFDPSSIASNSRASATPDSTAIDQDSVLASSGPIETSVTTSRRLGSTGQLDFDPANPANAGFSEYDLTSTHQDNVVMQMPAWTEMVGDTPIEHAKTILASFGMVALVFRLTRSSKNSQKESD